jgi:transcriptional regulator with XRE-family HTH domain
MTLRDAEEATGLSKDTISRIERGRKPQQATIDKLAKAYGRSPDEFIESEQPMTLDRLDVASLLQVNKSLSDEILKAREAEDQDRINELYEQLAAVSSALIRKGPLTESEASVRRRARLKRQEAEDTAAEAG